MSSAGVRAGGAFIEIFAKDGQFQQAMRRIETKMRTIGTAMRQAGTSMVMGAGAVGAPMVLALRQFAAFDDVLRATQASTGMTAAEFDKVRSAALAMSKALGISPTEVASGFMELLKAGMSLEEVLGGAGQAAIQFANISGMSVGEASVIMADAMKVFGVSGEMAANTLSAAADASSTDIQGIALAFSQVSAVAALSNQSISGTAAALAILANNGVKGSDAGTSLKTMLMRLMAPADDAVEALGQVGLSVNSFRNADGSMKPLIEIIGTLNGSMAGLNQTARDDIFRRIFGADAIRAAAILTTAGVSGFDAMAQGMAGALSVSEKFKTMMEGMSGSMKRLLAAAQRLAIAFGTAVAPAAQMIAGALEGFVDVVERLAAENPILSQTLAGVTGSVFGLGVALVAGGFALQVMAAGFRPLAAILSVLPALCNPVGLAIMGIAAAAAATVVVARQLSPAFREETDAIAAALMSGNITGAFDILIGNLAIGWLQASQAAEDAMDAMANGMTMVGSLITDTLIGGLDSFMSLFGSDILALQSGWEKLGVFMRAAWDWDFWTNGMQAALDEIDARTQQAREELPTADARAAARTADRQAAADERGAANAAREERQAAELREARAMLNEAHQRVKDATTDAAKTDADRALKLAEARVNSLLASPAAATATTGNGRASNGFVTASAGFGGTDGLGIGPELGRLEEPAQQTAQNTAQIAASMAAQNAEVAALTAQADATPSALDAVMRGEAIPALSAVGDSAATQAAVAAVQEAAAAQTAAKPPLPATGSAVANTAAASNLPAAAAQTAAGTRSATETQSISGAIQNGVKAIVQQIQAHAKISEAHSGFLKKIVENTGKPGEVFA